MIVKKVFESGILIMISGVMKDMIVICLNLSMDSIVREKLRNNDFVFFMKILVGWKLKNKNLMILFNSIRYIKVIIILFIKKDIMVMVFIVILDILVVRLFRLLIRLIVFVILIIYRIVSGMDI